MRAQQTRMRAGGRGAGTRHAATSRPRLLSQPRHWHLFSSSSSSSRSRSRSGGSSTRQLQCVRAVQVDEEDLMQFPDRYKWYEAKFAADDMPDWNPGRFVSINQEAPGQRLLTFEAEVSRERVPLRNAYRAAGQQAVIRINGGEARTLPVVSPPFEEDLNKEGLFLLKGDLFSGETKQAREPTSVLATVQVLVDKEAAPEVYTMSPDDLISVGPFAGTGLDTRTSGLLGVFKYPTVVIFASGAGIATAAALIASPHGSPTHISPTLRTDVRLYYHAPNRASLCLADRFEAWEEEFGVKVVPTTTGFMDAWDGDDTLVYEPDATAAIVLTGGDAESEAAALEVCREAEISAIIPDSQPAAPPVYLDSTPKSFLRWRNKAQEAAAAAAADPDADAELSTDLTD